MLANGSCTKLSPSTCTAPFLYNQIHGVVDTPHVNNVDRSVTGGVSLGREPGWGGSSINHSL